MPGRAIPDDQRLSRHKDEFDDAMGRFAVAYADQAERDHKALKAAVRAGTIEVQIEEDR